MGMISDSFHRLLVGKRDDTIPVLAAKLNISAAKLYAKMNPYDQEHDLKIWEADHNIMTSTVTVNTVHGKAKIAEYWMGMQS